jgi:hypothetical protein
MTPEQLRSIIDNWAARAQACANNGERAASRVYIDCLRQLSDYLPANASEPAVEAPKPQYVPADSEGPEKASKGAFSGWRKGVDRGGKPFSDRDES